MEPDINKILSNRIRQTELRPVAWNREVVWQKVLSETHPKRRYNFFYYAAAAIVSLLIYFVVERIPNEKTPHVADTKTTPRQEATESEGPVVPEQIQKQTPAPVAANPNTTGRAPQKEMSGTGERPASAPLEMETADFVAQPVLPDMQLPEEISLALEEIEIPAKKIRPIVGIIGESYAENITNVKRKKGLRKLEPSPAVPWQDPGNALVFTVRK